MNLILILAVLWLLGFIQIPGLILRNAVLFRINGHTITLWEILILVFLLWIVETLPTPVRQIIVVFVLLWVLSVIGFITVSGLSNLIIAGIIIGVLLSRGHNKS